jgi:septal ring factor EnvC (AmiA/AmiB activator)
MCFWICRSLLSLSRVIHSLSLPAKKRPKHIGYRDSKLTRIMQSHLSGKACLAVLCCVSPAREHLEETRSTLKFADNAKQIKVKPTINEFVDQGTLLLSLQKELKVTKEGLRQLQETLSRDPSHMSSTLSTLDEMPSKALEAYVPRGKYIHEASLNHPEQDQTDTLSEVVLGEDLQSPHEIVDKQLADVPQDASTISVTSGMPPVKEVLVLVKCPTFTSRDTGDRVGEAEDRVTFLADKLEATDDLVEALFKELREVQEHNQDLDMYNAELDYRLTHMRGREGVQSEEADLFTQQCKLLKYAIALALAFYVGGQSEVCLAIVFFLWLSLMVVTN